MSRIISLFIAAAIIGFLIFALMYWILKNEFFFSVNVGLSGALGGLAAEFMRSYIEKRKRNKLLRETNKKN